MEEVIKYKINIDGIVYYEEFDTVDEAIKMIKLYFADNHSLHHADVLKYTVKNVGIRVNNKNFEKDLVK